MKTTTLLMQCVLVSVAWTQARVAPPASIGQGRSIPLTAVPEADKDRAELDRILVVRAAITGSDRGRGLAGVAVDVQNVSGRTITAHAGSVVAQYADGHEVSRGWSDDVLMDTVLTQVPGLTIRSPRTLRNGETRQLKLLLPTGADGSAPLAVRAQATTVVFEDRTALGSSREIGAVSEARRLHSEDLLDVIGRIQTAQAHPSVLAAIRTQADPMPALRAALSEQINQIGDVPTGRAASRSGMLQQWLKLLQNGAPPVFLDSLVRSNQAVQRAMADHSTLTEAK
jgi:hypothetical protein